MERSTNGLDKTTKQTITMILGIISLFIGIPVFLDNSIAGIAILSIPAIYHLSIKLILPIIQRELKSTDDRRFA